jgi:hypothetical protein
MLVELAIAIVVVQLAKKHADAAAAAAKRFVARPSLVPGCSASSLPPTSLIEVS